MYTKLSIPERLKDLRVVDKHLTLEQLAEQTGLSRSALGKYESDDYKAVSYTHLDVYKRQTWPSAGSALPLD